MQSHHSNPNNRIGLNKAKENRSPFLMVDVDIWDKLPPYTLKVYGQLRKLVDFREQHDEVQITVEILAIKSGISERKTYQVLSELERDHFLIKRIHKNSPLIGHINSYDVAQTYGFFNTNYEQHAAPHAASTARHAESPAYYADSTAPNAVPIDQHCFQQSIQHVCGEAHASTTQHTIDNRKEKAHKTAIECEEVKALFVEKFTGRNVTIEKITEDCKDHYEQKGAWLTKKKLISWLQREKPENYTKQDTNDKKHNQVTALFTEEENNLMQEALHAKRVAKLGQDINLFITPEKLVKAEELFARARSKMEPVPQQRRNMPGKSMTAVSALSSIIAKMTLNTEGKENIVPEGMSPA